MQGQKLDYSGIEEALGKVIQAGDTTETNLKSIDKLIEESVGDDGYVWAGDAADAFKASWATLAEELPKFIQNVRTQADNIRTAKEITQSKDTTSSGTVN